MNLILLDTHAAVWSAEGTLARTAAEQVDAAAKRGELLLSPITAWEIGVLVRKKRLTLAIPLDDYVRLLFVQSRVTTATLTAAIAAEAANLPTSLGADPADCILVASAAAYGASLMTRDRRILDYAKTAKTLRCLRC